MLWSIFDKQSENKAIAYHYLTYCKLRIMYGNTKSGRWNKSDSACIAEKLGLSLRKFRSHIKACKSYNWIRDNHQNPTQEQIVSVYTCGASKDRSQYSYGFQRCVAIDNEQVMSYSWKTISLFKANMMILLDAYHEFHAENRQKVQDHLEALASEYQYHVAIKTVKRKRIQENREERTLFNKLYSKNQILVKIDKADSHSESTPRISTEVSAKICNISKSSVCRLRKKVTNNDQLSLLAKYTADREELPKYLGSNQSMIDDINSYVSDTMKQLHHKGFVFINRYGEVVFNHITKFEVSTSVKFKLRPVRSHNFGFVGLTLSSVEESRKLDRDTYLSQLNNKHYQKKALTLFPVTEFNSDPYSPINLDTNSPINLDTNSPSIIDTVEQYHNLDTGWKGKRKIN